MKLRIAVSVDDTGDHSAFSITGSMSDAEAMSYTYDVLDGEIVARYIVEVDVPDVPLLKVVDGVAKSLPAEGDTP